MAGLWLARRPPLRALRRAGRAAGLRAGAGGVPGARAVAAVLGGSFCAIVNRPHPGLQPSVPREALNTGRGLFGEVLQHIINSIIFNDHWKAETNRSAMNFLPPCSPRPRSPWGCGGVGGGPTSLVWLLAKIHGPRHAAGDPVHRAPSPGSVPRIARPVPGDTWQRACPQGRSPHLRALRRVPRE